MSSSPERQRCERRDLVGPYALAALEREETELMDAHLPTCAECQREYQALRPVTSTLSAWRAQTLPSPEPLWDQLAKRIASEPRQKADVAHSSNPPALGWPEPRWMEAAPGIACKLLSTDSEADRVSMLVRLLPGVDYPPHTHAGLEELFLLDGELWIDERKLHPGDYNRAEPGTGDKRVWSETGCTCVLITSTRDMLR